MKKLILSVGLAILSLHAFPQTGGLNGTPSILTPSSSDSAIPSGQGFGGALGGATTNSIPNSSYNTTPGTSNTNSQGVGTLEQQRMEAPSMNGSSLGGSALPPSTTTPPGTTLPQNPGSPMTPSSPSPATNVPSATGVGTGSPSGF